MYDFHFFSPLMNEIVTEPLVESLLFLLVAVFILFLQKGNKILLIVASILSVALYFTRLASVFGVLFLLAMIVWGLVINWRRYWLPALSSVTLYFILFFMPAIISHSDNTVPSKYSAPAKLACFALEIAAPDDVHTVPNEAQRTFLLRALQKRQAAYENIKNEPWKDIDKTRYLLSTAFNNGFAYNTAETIARETGQNATQIMLSTFLQLIARHPLGYTKLIWDSVQYGTNITRLTFPFGFWAFIIPLFIVCLILRGWVGYGSAVLMLAHLSHALIASLFDVPTTRYIWVTEFLVLIAAFLLIFGVAERLGILVSQYMLHSVSDESSATS